MGHQWPYCQIQHKGIRYHQTGEWFGQNMFDMITFSGKPIQDLGFGTHLSITLHGKIKAFAAKFILFWDVFKIQSLMVSRYERAANTCK